MPKSVKSTDDTPFGSAKGFLELDSCLISGKADQRVTNHDAEVVTKCELSAGMIGKPFRKHIDQKSWHFNVPICCGTRSHALAFTNDN